MQIFNTSAKNEHRTQRKTFRKENTEIMNDFVVVKVNGAFDLVFNILHGAIGVLFFGVWHCREEKTIEKASR